MFYLRNYSFIWFSLIHLILKVDQPLTSFQHLFLIDLIQSMRVLITLVKGLPLTQHTHIACQRHIRHCAGHTGCKTEDQPASLCSLQSSFVGLLTVLSNSPSLLACFSPHLPFCLCSVLHHAASTPVRGFVGGP